MRGGLAFLLFLATSRGRCTTPTSGGWHSGARCGGEAEIGEGAAAVRVDDQLRHPSVTQDEDVRSELVDGNSAVLATGPVAI